MAQRRVKKAVVPWCPEITLLKFLSVNDSRKVINIEKQISTHPHAGPAGKAVSPVVVCSRPPESQGRNTVEEFLSTLVQAVDPAEVICEDIRHISLSDTERIITEYDFHTLPSLLHTPVSALCPPLLYHWH